MIHSGAIMLGVSKMDKIRISESNRLKNKHREIEGYIRLNQNAIVRLRKCTTSIEFNKERISKLKQQISTLETELEDVKERKRKLDLGELDKELALTFKKDTEIERSKTAEKRQKKILEAQDKKERSVKSRAYWERTMKAGRAERYEKRSANKGYDYLLRVHDSLPQYIRQNLQKMPNNKGYIWRGVHYYGHKDPEGNKCVLFESKRGVLNIHEWSEDWLTYKLSVKENKKSKEVVVKYIDTFKKNSEGKRIFVDRTVPKPKKQRYSGNKKYNKKKYTPKRKLTPAEARRRSRGLSSAHRRENGSAKTNLRPSAPRNNGVGNAKRRGAAAKRRGRNKKKKTTENK